MNTSPSSTRIAKNCASWPATPAGVSPPMWPTRRVPRRCSPSISGSPPTRGSGHDGAPMMSLGGLAFLSPWLLVGLAALPVLWWLLRLTPPAPKRIPFPAIRLLFGLLPKEETPHRTPWWLILLRLAIAALLIVGLSHPLWNAAQ